MIDGQLRFFCNPEIVSEDESQVYEEGCLSIPGINANVTRPGRIGLSWCDDSMKSKQQIFRGFNAVVCQHEYDHLNGVMFIDKVSDADKARIEIEMEGVCLRKFSREPEYLWV